MADVKNFGLVGVGSTVQWAKGGSRIKTTGGTFNLRNAADSSDVALTAAGITSSSGNVTLTTGNLIASAGDINATLGDLNLAATDAVVVIGTDTTLSRQQAGVFQFNGTAAMVLPNGTTGQRPGTAVAGMFRFNDTDDALEYYTGATWTQITGTGALQTEINNIETSLGAGIDSNGDFVAGAFNAPIATATSFTNAINQLADYIDDNNTLDEIFPALSAGNVIYANGSNLWVQAAPGATSGVQGYDADLAAIAALSSTGIAVRTAADTWTTRTLVAPAAGITITNPAGIAGNPTFALANDLAALEGLTTTGYIVRTGDGTATTRTINGVAGRIVVTNGDGVSSNTDVDLDTVTNPGNGGSFVKVTTDAYGRVTNSTAVVTADITALVDGTYVNVAGDTMTGNLDFGGTNKVTGLATPTNASDAANKAYVDATAAGLTWKTAVLNATTVAGGNITLSGEQTIDGVLTSASRILVKNQTDPAENGIYVTAAGAWTRSTDADSPSELDGAAVFVQQGTLNADTGWVQTNTIVTVGTTAVTWVQFSGSSTYVAGDGLLLTGNTFSVNMGAGITTLPSDEVGIDVVAGLAVQLTSALTGGQLTFVLDSGSGLEQSASGLKISADGVTNAMLLNDFITINTDAGNDPVALGETLLIAGTSTQGISTASTANTVTITAADATSSQKGVASFTTGKFVVTAGNVDLGSIPNSNLTNSTITFTGDTGTEAVALGESFDFNGDSTFITTAVSGNVVSFTLGTVDVPHGGTGLTSVTTGQILYGANTSPLGNSSAFTFDGTDTLTVGTGTFEGNATDLVITATATNGDIVLLPNGSGSVIVGSTGAGIIQSDPGEALTVRGNDGLTLESGTAGQDIIMLVPTGTGTKVTVGGASAADYATGLADADLVNKKYVDDAISTGAAAGAIKAVTATVSLASTGATNVGATLPAGATILSVKVNVTAADTATGTLQVGKSGGDQYMTTSENDTQTTGLYMAETYVVEAGAVQVEATVGGTPGGSGSAQVIVTYKVAG